MFNDVCVCLILFLLSLCLCPFSSTGLDGGQGERNVDRVKKDRMLRKIVMACVSCLTRYSSKQAANFSARFS